ncbi:hypothetical protein BDV06DRAFT_186680 [Aspergillus oleicola]
MAKSVRASVQKRNKAKLRSTVFGPAVDARTKRLSAKLQELAAQPKPSHQEQSKTDESATKMNRQDENEKTNSTEAMDVDSSNSTGGRSQRSGKIQKRQRKNRSSIVFKPHPSKTKRAPRKK